MLTAIAGCKSGPEATTYKIVAGTTSTVDTARKAWNDYVRRGLSNPSEVKAVADAYDKYASAVSLADVAVASYKQSGDQTALDTAVKIVNDSRDAFLKLVNQLMTK